MQFDRGAAVFKLKSLFNRGERQFAFFADRHEAYIQLIRHHGAEDEATRVEAGNHVRPRLRIHVPVHKGVYQDTEYLGVLQQRSDVAKLHTGSRPVGYGADMVAQVLLDAEVLHGLS